ncbi:hypothetical protein FQA47_013963 [Oryzias melastigma]|uniref:Uncharacterized protein n=1 Tax=Oryzias melastigma TaxID=30732 RepID=A0A834CJ22_ORYME|nr:hypothetical protein FQA47_013963 [Oryzias melastigma]
MWGEVLCKEKEQEKERGLNDLLGKSGTAVRKEDGGSADSYRRTGAATGISGCVSRDSALQTLYPRAGGKWNTAGVGERTKVVFGFIMARCV